MRYWITAEPWDGLSIDEIDKATEAGCPQILHGIPPNLADVIPEGTVGPFEVPDPEPPTPEPPPPDPVLVAAEAIRTEITLRLEPATSLDDVKAAVIDGLTAAVAGLAPTVDDDSETPDNPET